MLIIACMVECGRATPSKLDIYLAFSYHILSLSFFLSSQDLWSKLAASCNVKKEQKPPKDINVNWISHFSSSSSFLWAHNITSNRKREDLAPGDKFVRIAFSEASAEVDTAINQTVASLFRPSPAETSSRRDYGDLFRIVRFPTGPARELARAAEIYERTLVNIRKHINAGSNVTANVSTNFTYDDILSTEYLELLAQLSDCAAHRTMPNCTDMWWVLFRLVKFMTWPALLFN